MSVEVCWCFAGILMLWVLDRIGGAVPASVGTGTTLLVLVPTLVPIVVIGQYYNPSVPVLTLVPIVVVGRYQNPWEPVQDYLVLLRFYLFLLL